MKTRTFSVIVPDNPDLLLALATNVWKKHQQDGANSILPPALMALFQIKLDIARAENTRCKDLDRLKEKLIEERNLLLGLHRNQSAYLEGTVRYFVTAVRDILLGHYRGSERMLGNWGYEVSTPKKGVRILIPTGPHLLIQLAKNILQKHDQDGANSLLHHLDMEMLRTKLEDAEKRQEDAAKAIRDKENATQTRNLALGIERGQTSKTPNTVKYIVKSVRDLLLGYCRGREQELGDWGFEVNTRTWSRDAGEGKNL
ncbi:MAG: hypothetical protein IPJ74_22945 [Saprospiraceae bacterium]|nr:hypothetical protein [Saprospiraceae bacterium]